MEYQLSVIKIYLAHVNFVLTTIRGTCTRATQRCHFEWLEWLSKIFYDTKRRTVSLRQLSFLFLMNDDVSYMVGTAESGRETWWSEVPRFDALWHRPTALLSIQQHRWQQRQPVRSRRRCRLRLRVGPDVMCGLSVWLWAARTSTCSTMQARVSCQLCRPVAQGLLLLHSLPVKW